MPLIAYASIHVYHNWRPAGERAVNEHTMDWRRRPAALIRVDSESSRAIALVYYLESEDDRDAEKKLLDFSFDRPSKH